ncbi:DUF3263 domain-containing protein [Nocardioides sp. TRM66260-LWL]|uniref:DUF3263 domain-containing protein n=1 Tax=Nocardioides sp. TRM66260-LWL TaxID=2874478 RepID=UPI001CC3E9E0|nr:DUF3263 domain-containing protein [Nocardioides sp. TRM66260-LWL]MBZ5736517.1 DUF3263 domain-containing protein [Nocardioides sp. TRM66260-LWL]
MDEPLTELEMEILDFERLRWRHAGARESAVLDRFGWSITRHAQVVNALLDRPAALEHDPVNLRRLQRLRDARRAQRTARIA